MYQYSKQRHFVFTEEGLKMLLRMRDQARKLLESSGAFREQELYSGFTGDSWNMLACCDYLVESNDIRLVYDKGARQHNVYTKGSNL